MQKAITCDNCGKAFDISETIETVVEVLPQQGVDLIHKYIRVCMQCDQEMTKLEGFDSA